MLPYVICEGHEKTLFYSLSPTVTMTSHSEVKPSALVAGQTARGTCACGLERLQLYYKGEARVKVTTIFSPTQPSQG
ncbi:hypothetical protein RRG08_023693 [Elysia crispata]|uniref:Uncharacterized protein n=1 Tax=Elysia crispata TaxID=231223 RepID=A0AAE1D9P9_9GAST|nr:hypothetical protein RRG08_023693 [Elysia crispata]